MATKTITITEEAYERLAMMKDGQESFSRVKVRRFPKPSLLALAGVLSKEEGDELERHIQARRSGS
ncbi:antitoxin VapB family protein [Candidatus Woesearchaeota archaeon]|nr:antitoxin VapB family protein [Candidatus Woesearchaeota archaeon]